MRASLRKALADYNLYLKKLGIDKIKKRKNRGTFVFDGGGNRNGVPTGDKIPVFTGGKKQERRTHGRQDPGVLRWQKAGVHIFRRTETDRHRFIA